MVGLDHYTIDEEADQPLPRGEVGILEVGTNLTDEFWELRTDRVAQLGIVERGIRLLERITENRLAALDLLPPAE